MPLSPRKTLRELATVWGVLLLASVASCAQPPDATGRPNVLFVLADDQRADTIAAWGNPVIQTPHLDRLVAEGFSFSRAYCMGSSGGAVCVPSRAMVHTGRTLFEAPTDMLGVPTLGEMARNAGYATFATGKWHNGPAAFHKSFELGRSVMFAGMSDHTEVPVHDLGSDGEFSDVRVAEKFSTTAFVDAAIELLEQHDDERPFFAYVALTAPHDPRQAPEGFTGMYDPEEVPLPPNFLPQHPLDNGWLVCRDENLAAWPRTEEVIREQIAEYYALITHMDSEVGRLLAALERLDLRDDTLIVFAADHGLALGSHGLLGKQNLYEHSMRAPLIVVGDGIPAGKSSDDLVYLFDLFPTLCEWFGAEAPDDIDGRSLAPIWRGEERESRGHLFTAFGNVMRAVRDDRWKLIVYPKINRSQLFDLTADPHEMRNLAASADHAAELERMTGILRRSQSEAREWLPLESSEPFPAQRDLTGLPREPDPWQPEWIVEKYFR